MSDLQTIQQEVGEWSAENFGTEQPATYPLAGAGEELGELVHSVLKRKQGIRLDEEDVGTEAEIDAVGDIGVYLLDYLYRADIPIGVDEPIRSETIDTNFDGNDIDLMGRLFREYGDLWSMHAIDGSDHNKAVCVVTIFIALDLFCQRRDGIESFRECLEVAWYGEVQDREWDADVEV